VTHLAYSGTAEQRGDLAQMLALRGELAEHVAVRAAAVARDLAAETGVPCAVILYGTAGPPVIVVPPEVDPALYRWPR
jgi:hypothetical protein